MGLAEGGEGKVGVAGVAAGVGPGGLAWGRLVGGLEGEGEGGREGEKEDVTMTHEEDSWGSGVFVSHCG